MTLRVWMGLCLLFVVACSGGGDAPLNTTFQVSVSGSHVTTSPSGTVTVSSGASQAFTVTAEAGYQLATSVGGSCPAGAWSGNSYTTGAITADCDVSFSAAQETFTVSSSGDGHETISPSGDQTVAAGSTQAFTVTASTGYTLSTAVGGDCPAGAWSGNTYTTGAITADCSVSFSATQQTFSVSASGDGNETISPSSAQTVAYGSTQAFTVTASLGYALSTTVGGDCPAGAWSGNTYTTGAITADCTVSFSAALQTFTVSASGDGNETISPSSAQTVAYGSTQSFTVTGQTGYALSTTVGGTCPAGTWSGNTYTTGTITADCSVSFSATYETFSILATADGHETVSPGSAQNVPYGTTVDFVVSANVGYTLSSTVGGTCAAGTWNGGTYTTGPITSNCTVAFSATLTPYAVTASGDGHETITPGSRSVVPGNTTTFDVTGDTGYAVSNTVGGTCPAGSWSGTTYTTGAITGDCSVSFSAALKSFTVAALADGHESVLPGTFPAVTYGDTATFSVHAAPHYTLSSTVGGDCAIGSWNGSDYTTGPITADCVVRFSATVDSYTVTASGDGHETITPSSQTTVYNTTASFDVTPDDHYVVSASVTGDCAAGSWSGSTYTTGAISGDCTVTFSASLETFTVSASADGHVSVNPANYFNAPYGSTQDFATSPSAGYDLSSTVGGTCAPGSWNGTTYTTGVITGDCYVSFSATPQTFTVSATGDGNETITPPSQDVDYSSTASFDVTAAAHYTLSPTVTGDCPAGSWSGSTYTTGAILAPCSVGFSATANVVNTVNVTGDGNESISPNPSQTVDFGTTASFDVTYDTGFLPTSVGGDCPIGSWSGSTYTTGTIAGYALLGENVNCDNSQAPIVSQDVASPEACAALCQSTTDCNFAAYYYQSGGLCNLTTFCSTPYATASASDHLYVMSSSCTVTIGSQPGYVVTPSGDGNELFTPSTPQTLAGGTTQSFTVTTLGGDPTTTAVSGTCPAGSWSGNVYTTGELDPWTALATGSSCDNSGAPLASSGAADSVLACYQRCLNDDACGYFTYYSDASWCNLNAVCDSPYATSADPTSTIYQLDSNAACTVVFGP